MGTMPEFYFDDTDWMFLVFIVALVVILAGAR